MAINAGKNFVSEALNCKFNASCFAAGTMIERYTSDMTDSQWEICFVCTFMPATFTIPSEEYILLKKLYIVIPHLLEFVKGL